MNEAMNEAIKAAENAITLEVKKDALAQRQSGDWSLRLTIAAVHFDQRIATAAMGTRYQCVLVEIDDDEQPVDHVLKEREQWNELGVVKQAALRCKDPVFWSYLREMTSYQDVNDEQGAAAVVRDICGVASRSHLGKPGYSDSRRTWHNLDNEFQAWKLVDG